MTIYNEGYEGTEPFSDTCAQMALATSAVLTYTVPGTKLNRYKAEFSWLITSSVYVGYNVTPAVPGAGLITSQPNVERNPDYRYVQGGDILSFISSAAAQAGLRLLQLPN